jgi:hypothetical protein
MDIIALTNAKKAKGTEMVNTRKAIVWGRDDLLARVVNHVLGANKSLDIVEVSSIDPEENLFGEIQRVKPDVVILCQEKIEDNPTLPLKLIWNCQTLRVISVDMVGNFVQVYSKYNVVLQNASDLLSVVEGRWFAEKELERVMVSKPLTGL